MKAPGSPVNRRHFIGGLAGFGMAQRLGANDQHIVGIKYGSDPYQTAMSAIASAGQFPAVQGKTVVIKPNLVAGEAASTGVSTDPQVVRAIVDTCLVAQAKAVVIVEGSGKGGGAPHFTGCGYDFFATYDPRVSLLDLNTEPMTVVSNPAAYLYRLMWLPAIAADPDTVWISAAKLKVHSMAGVSLATKNMFGLYSPTTYGGFTWGNFLPRRDPHELGMDQAIAELAAIRPIHYSVIDGIVGMQGSGPLDGWPISSNVVVAGANSVAVDRVGAEIMGTDQGRIPHLATAGNLGLGPLSLNSVTIAGDPLVPASFAQPFVYLPPTLWPSHYPTLTQRGSGGAIGYQVPPGTTYLARLEVITDDNLNPGVMVKRVVFDWRTVFPGQRTLAWNGKDDEGSFLPPGKYFVRLLTRYHAINGGRITVNSASRPFWVL